MNHLPATEQTNGLRIPALTADYMRLALRHLAEVLDTASPGTAAPLRELLARMGQAGHEAILDPANTVLMHRMLQDGGAALSAGDHTYELDMVFKMKGLLPQPHGTEPEAGQLLQRDAAGPDGAGLH